MGVHSSDLTKSVGPLSTLAFQIVLVYQILCSSSFSLLLFFSLSNQLNCLRLLKQKCHPSIMTYFSLLDKFSHGKRGWRTIQVHRPSRNTKTLPEEWKLWQKLAQRSFQRFHHERKYLIYGEQCWLFFFSFVICIFCIRIFRHSLYMYMPLKNIFKTKALCLSLWAHNLNPRMIK